MIARRKEKRPARLVDDHLADVGRPGVRRLGVGGINLRRVSRPEGGAAGSRRRAAP